MAKATKRKAEHQDVLGLNGLSSNQFKDSIAANKELSAHVHSSTPSYRMGPKGKRSEIQRREAHELRKTTNPPAHVYVSPSSRWQAPKRPRLNEGKTYLSKKAATPIKYIDTSPANIVI